MRSTDLHITGAAAGVPNLLGPSSPDSKLPFNGAWQHAAKGTAGFTLIEVVVAMALLATIMMLLSSGLTFALRSWDAGDANGRRVADRRLGENFMRREMTELFPLRWK